MVIIEQSWYFLLALLFVSFHTKVFNSRLPEDHQGSGSNYQTGIDLVEEAYE